ncbi:MAG TPA: galactose-1-phosphate uridylyltransferase [candidate division Zixibacteria bacterium]|nr:galactose-1-phosphate uridylyltransferase [candidate division Zixibacteria bacterium]
MPELRKDPFSTRWVIVAPERAGRPGSRLDRRGDAAPCPFCSGAENNTPPEVLAYRDDAGRPNGPGWRLRVVPNKYPALGADESAESPQPSPFRESMSAVGAHEVIIESPDHVKRAAELGLTRLEEVLSAYRDRIAAHRANDAWRYVLVYKNEGAAAGATLEHVHSQLVAAPLLPPDFSAELRLADEFYRARGRCRYCDWIEDERRDRSRLVSENGRFVALCPYAPRFPYETWILPIDHAADFGSTAPSLRALAEILQDLLGRIDRRLGRPALNWVLRSAPLRGHENSYHWRFEVLPRITGVAGFEWGSGMFINTVPPEESAGALRSA